MTCRELSEFLIEYRSGELKPEVHADFEAHLRLCPDCVAYVRDYEATIRAARDAFAEPDAPVPEDVPEDLVEAIVAARRNAVRAGPGSGRR